MSREHRWHIDHRHTSHVVGGNLLQRADDRHQFWREIGLYAGNHHIFAALMPAAALVEQLERFPDTRCVAEEDLQLAAPLGPFRGLNLTEEHLRIAVALNGHAYNS